MALVGYARVSTTDQSTAIQEQELKAAGCEKVFAEQMTGTVLDRPQLDACLDYMREGDVLVFSRLDRIARDAKGLHILADELEKRGIKIKALHQEIDTTTAQGKLMLGMLAAFAEFETELRKERQAAGIAKRKADKGYKGRKPVSDEKLQNAVDAVKAGIPKAKAARDAGISRSVLYKHLAKQG